MTTSSSWNEQRVHRAAQRILLANTKGSLELLCRSTEVKKTCCYKLTRDGDDASLASYFVKVSEDSTTNPIKIAKRLYSKQRLNDALSGFVVLPTSKPQRVFLDIDTRYALLAHTANMMGCCVRVSVPTT